MSESRIFDLVLSVFFIISGAVNVRRGYRGLLPKPEFITLGRNPSPPATMTPGMQKFAKAGGLFMIGAGVLGIGLTMISSFHGR